jgi:hypothetical protein
MPKEKKEDVLKSRLDRMWSEAESGRTQHDWKWFIYDMWVKGHQDARYDKKTRRIISGGTSDGRPKVSINKIFPTLRSVRNYVLRNQPKAQVTPEGMNKDNLEEALKSNHFLDFVHETERLRPKLKGSVMSALKYSKSWWQVVWNGEKIEINECDTFDVYPDPKARTRNEMRYLVLAVRRSLDTLKENEMYDKKEVEQIKPDNKTAASSYKQMSLNYENSGEVNNTKESETVIVKEFWYKEDGKIYVCTMAGDRVIRKPEEIDSKIIPFFDLSSDIEQLRMYTEGWVKHMIDPQKLLNSAVSSLAEYNIIMNKGRIITDKGAGVRIITNQHGSIIEKKRGYDVRHEAIQPLGAAIYQQIDYANVFIEDIGSMHEASRGRVPTGAKSGRAIEALQIGDANNLSELVENIEDFLEDVYEYVLWLASKKYQDMRTIMPLDYTGQRQFLRVVGESSPVAQQLTGNEEDVLVIREKNLVDVKISSYLAHTPEAKRESVKELFSIIPDLPMDVVLDAYGVGNIADVIKKIKEKQEEDKQAELESQQTQQEMQLQGKQQEQQMTNPESTAQEAIAAIRTMIQGGTPQVPTNPGQNYISAIDQFLQREQESGELDPQVLQAVQTFRDQIIQGVGR